MLKFFLLIAAGLGVLTLSELIRKYVGLHNEYSRKTYHVVHALLFGISPFFISYEIIIGLELLLLIEMIAARRLKLFRWLYEVGRVTWGDMFTVAGVVLIAAQQPNKWVFLAAMLHLGLADTMAALVGRRYGKSTQYKVFGQTKSLMGSAAFYVTSLLITFIVISFTPLGDMSVPLLILLLPPLVTLAENVSFFGSDNFVIPVVVVAVLQIS